MKILFDENVPKRLKKDFPDFSVFTVQEMGWEGKTNGELLTLLVRHNFKAVITADKNIEYQQNFTKYPLPVIVLNTRLTSYKFIQPYASEIAKFLVHTPKPGLTKIPS